MKRFGLIVLLTGLCAGQLGAASISGTVQSQMLREPIPGALIILQKPHDNSFSVTTTSDKQGNFVIENVEPSTYHIEAAKKGFYKNVLFDLKVQSERNYTVMVRLLQQRIESSDEYCFMLGGIEVCSVEREVIPEDPVTIRKIDSGEIAHMQATNLGDVLALVPGIEKTKNQGLADATKVGVRTISTRSANPDALETFGTVIIVDENQMTNDANMTTMVYDRSAISGVDLRTIPADNIESVEVITGIPSVEYGNFANGIIKVNTKSGVITPKLKAKLNPDTKTASFSHGFRFKQSVLDYHVNYGYSERNLRKDGDEYHRIHGNATYTHNFLDDRLETKLRSSFTKLVDNERPTDVSKMSSTNKCYITSHNLKLEYQEQEDRKTMAYIGFNLDHKDGHKQKWVAEQIVIEDSIYAGYFGKKEEIGNEWNLRAKLKRYRTLEGKRSKHELLAGIEWDYQKNTGDGLILDPVFSYYGPYSARRSFPYDDFPDLTTFSFYAQDDVSGKLLGKKYALILGLRYDAFNPTGFSFEELTKNGNLLKSNHGDFFCPRANFQYFFSDKLRLRLGAGKSAKAVSLGYMFREPAYNQYQQDTTIIVEIQERYNPELQTYTTDKYEISLDIKPVESIGFSLTGYYSESENRPSSISYPWGYDVNPDTISSKTYSIYDNRGWNRSRGLEFTLRTKRFHNFQYKLNVTYRNSESGQIGRVYDASPDTTWEEVWYPANSRFREKVIVDGQINYINQRLGTWITLEAQYIPFERTQDKYHGNTTYKEVEGLEEAKLFYQRMAEWWDRKPIDSGGRILINLRISKSIAHNTELSLYINNIFDDRARWKHPYREDSLYSEHNPPIYYGLEVSTQW